MRTAIGITIVGTLAVLCLVLTLVARSCNFELWDPASVRESQAIGDAIIAAAAHFHADQNALPTALEELVPRYINCITPPKAGTRRWIYSKEGEGAFRLGFVANQDGYPCCVFDWKDGSGHWWEDQ
jgi:hypothetical protein